MAKTTEGQIVDGVLIGAWNNAGPGHTALCELNYTPEKEDGICHKSNGCLCGQIRAGSISAGKTGSLLSIGMKG